MKKSDINNKVKYIVLQSLIFLFVATGCTKDEFFELKSPPNTGWESVRDMEYGITSVYRQFVNKNEDGIWFLDPFIHYGMSDIVREIGQNGGWSTDAIVRRETDQRLSKVDHLGMGYKTILYSNNMLDFIETDPFPDATEVDKEMNINRIKGEALFLRAMAYYHLLTWYAPAYDINSANDSRILPLRLNAPKTIGLALNNAPVETQLVYDQVVEDLRTAKGLLPLKYKSGMHPAYEFGRANKHAAMAALARVLILMGRYDEALVELNGVLDDPELSRALETDPEDVWLNNSTTPTNNGEVIWYGYYADIEAAQSMKIHEIRIWGYFINSIYQDPSQTKNWWIWGINRGTLLRCGMLNEDNTVPHSWTYDKRNILFNRFHGYNPKMNEGLARSQQRVDSLYGKAFAPFVGFDDPVFISSKYYRVPAIADLGSEPPQNIPIMRSAELYLWRAALKQVTGKGGQADDLNIIRERSWDTAGGAYVPLSDGETTWDVIDQEWVKEMSFEGDRIIWLQMFKKPIGPGDRIGVDPVYPPYEGMNWLVPLGETDFYPTGD
ncbi:MAG: RagB/SusD family nutrient uptake outer membrane protein [Cyclobacteriaceae bacterium]|nr:RagB/SusD family nutrient uptake outer membrane protein [Cyclobacteriaceae bacterium]